MTKSEHKNRYSYFVRVVACLIITTFLFHDLAWAFPDNLFPNHSENNKFSPQSFFRNRGSRAVARAVYDDIAGSRGLPPSADESARGESPDPGVGGGDGAAVEGYKMEAAKLGAIDSVMERYSRFIRALEKLVYLRIFNAEKYILWMPIFENRRLPPESPDMAADEASIGIDYGWDGSNDGGDIRNPIIRRHILSDNAVEIKSGDRVIVRIRRDRSNPRDPLLESRFESNGILGNIRKARDRALLMAELDKGPNFRNLSPEERVRLVDEARKITVSVLLGQTVIDNMIYAHIRAGFNKHIHGLDPTMWMCELPLAKMTPAQIARLLLEECQHLVRPLRFVDGKWLGLHWKRGVNEDPKTTVKHDPDFMSLLRFLAYGRKDAEGVKFTADPRSARRLGVSLEEAKMLRNGDTAIPVMSCERHDGVVEWIKSFQAAGIAGKETTIINFDTHSDAVDDWGKLHIGSWARHIKDEGISTGRRVWVSSGKQAVYDRSRPEDEEYVYGKDIYRSIEALKKDVSGPAIVTIDYDYIAPKYGGYVTEGIVLETAGSILSSIFDSGIIPIAINFTFSSEYLVNPQPIGYGIPAQSVREMISNSFAKELIKRGFSLEAASLTKPQPADIGSDHVVTVSYEEAQLPHFAATEESIREEEELYRAWRAGQEAIGIVMPPIADISRRTSNGIWRQSVNKALMLFDIAKAARGARVLDIGSGNGRFAAKIAHMFGVIVRGVEIDPSLASEAQVYASHAAANLGIDIDFERGNFLDMDFSGYDIIYYCSLGSDNYEELESMVLRRLRPGQKFIVFRDVSAQPFDKLKERMRWTRIVEADGRVLGIIYEIPALPEDDPARSAAGGGTRDPDPGPADIGATDGEPGLKVRQAISDIYESEYRKRGRPAALGQNSYVRYGHFAHTPVEVFGEAVKLAALEEGARVFDFGSGDGWAAYNLASYGIFVDGAELESDLADLHKDMRAGLIREAASGTLPAGISAALSACADRVSLRHRDIFSAGTDFSGYDAVYMYYPEPREGEERFVSEMGRVLSDPKTGLRKGAKLIVLRDGVAAPIAINGLRRTALNTVGVDSRMFLKDCTLAVYERQDPTPPPELSALRELFRPGLISKEMKDGSRVLLSENLFIDKDDGESDLRLQQIKVALGALISSGAVAIMKPGEIRRAAMNRSVTKERMAAVFTREDFDDKAVWNGSDKETSLRSSVLILDDRMTGNKYLYLEGVIGLARAVMARNKEAIRAYYRLISGVAIDDRLLDMLKDGDQNNVAFALKAVLRFRPITMLADSEEFNRARVSMENALISA